MIADSLFDAAGLMVRWLAVLGGALLGGLFSGLVAQVTARAVRRRPAPLVAVRSLRLLGAVAGGLIVYHFFGGTGFGPGGPGSGDSGSGNSATTPTQQTSPLATGPTVDRQGVLTVEMLGGARYKGEVHENLDRDRDRFYLVKGIAEPQTWVEVRDLIRKNKAHLKELDIVIREKGSVAEGHEAVKALKQLAGDENLSVRVIKPTGEG